MTPLDKAIAPVVARVLVRVMLERREALAEAA